MNKVYNYAPTAIPGWHQSEKILELIDCFLQTIKNGEKISKIERRLKKLLKAYAHETRTLTFYYEYDRYIYGKKENGSIIGYTYILTQAGTFEVVEYSKRGNPIGIAWKLTRNGDLLSYSYNNGRIDGKCQSQNLYTHTTTKQTISATGLQGIREIKIYNPPVSVLMQCFTISLIKIKVSEPYINNLLNGVIIIDIPEGQIQIPVKNGIQNDTITVKNNTLGRTLSIIPGKTRPTQIVLTFDKDKGITDDIGQIESIIWALGSPNAYTYREKKRLYRNGDIYDLEFHEQLHANAYTNQIIETCYYTTQNFKLTPIDPFKELGTLDLIYILNKIEETTCFYSTSSNTLYRKILNALLIYGVNQFKPPSNFTL